MLGDVTKQNFALLKVNKTVFELFNIIRFSFFTFPVSNLEVRLKDSLEEVLWKGEKKSHCFHKAAAAERVHAEYNSGK